MRRQDLDNVVPTSWWLVVGRKVQTTACWRKKGHIEPHTTGRYAGDVPFVNEIRLSKYTLLTKIYPYNSTQEDIRSIHIMYNNDVILVHDKI